GRNSDSPARRASRRASFGYHRLIAEVRIPPEETSMHDLVIRGGTVVDGTGAAPRQADVAIDGDRITAVGPSLGKGKREVDARHLLVTPGFVDIHTHYDG